MPFTLFLVYFPVHYLYSRLLPLHNLIWSLFYQISFIFVSQCTFRITFLQCKSYLLILSLIIIKAAFFTLCKILINLKRNFVSTNSFKRPFPVFDVLTVEVCFHGWQLTEERAFKIPPLNFGSTVELSIELLETHFGHYGVWTDQNMISS